MFIYASTVIISLRNVAACLIQLFLDIFFLSHFYDPVIIFPVLLLMLVMIMINSLAEEHSACFHSSEKAVVLVCLLLLGLFLCSKPELLQRHVIVCEFQGILQQTYHVSGCAARF